MPIQKLRPTFTFTEDRLAAQLSDGIQYHFIDDWCKMSQFHDVLQAWKECVVLADKSLYDAVICGSQVERDFVVGLEHRDGIKRSIKLPDWFVVPTPIGNYNSEWAIVMAYPDHPGKGRLYLVAETKGTSAPFKLQYTTEAPKIHCGQQHFKELRVPYCVCKTTADLPGAHLPTPQDPPW